MHIVLNKAHLTTAGLATACIGVMATRLKIVSAIGRSARFTVRILAWIPVLIVALVLIWGYYVYVYVMNFSGKFAHMNVKINVVAY